MLPFDTNILVHNPVVTLYMYCLFSDVMCFDGLSIYVSQVIVMFKIIN